MNQKSYLQKSHEKPRQKNKVSQTNNKKYRKKAIDSNNTVKMPKSAINKGKDDHLILFKKTETTQRSLQKPKEKGRPKGCKTKDLGNNHKNIRPKTAREDYINHSLSKSKSRSKSPTITRKNTGCLTERKIKPKKNQSPTKKSKISKQLFATPQKLNQKLHQQKRQPSRLIYSEESQESQTQRGQKIHQNEQKQQIFVKIDQSKVEKQSKDNQIFTINRKISLKQIKTTFSARKKSIIDEILLQKFQNKKIENKHQFSIQSRILSSINEQQQTKRLNKKKSINNNQQRDEITRFKQQQQRKWKKMLQQIKRLKDSGDIEKNIDDLIKQITLNAQQIKHQGIKIRYNTKQNNQEEAPKCSQNTLSEYSQSANQKNLKDKINNRLNVSEQKQLEIIQGINEDTFVNIAQISQDTQLISIQTMHCIDGLTINYQSQKLRFNGISLSDFFIHDKKSSFQLKQDLYEPRMALNRLQSQLIIQSKLQVKLPPIYEHIKNHDNSQIKPVQPGKITTNLDNQQGNVQSNIQSTQNKNHKIINEVLKKEQQHDNQKDKIVEKISISLDIYQQKQPDRLENCLKQLQIERKQQKNTLFQKIADENLYQNVANAITQYLLVQFAHKILQNEKILHFLLTNYEQYGVINQESQLYHDKPKQPSSNQYAFWLMHRLLDYLVDKHNDYLCQQVTFYYQCKPIDVLKYVRSCEDPQNDEDSYDIENDQLIQIPFFNLQKVYIFQTQQLENIHYLPSYFSFNQCIYDSLNDIVDKIRPFGNKGKSIFSIQLSHPIKGASKIKQQVLSEFTNIFNNSSDIETIKDNLVHGQEGNFQIIYFVSLQVAEAIYNQSVYQLYNVYRKKTFQQ